MRLPGGILDGLDVINAIAALAEGAHEYVSKPAVIFKEQEFQGSTSDNSLPTACESRMNFGSNRIHRLLTATGAASGLKAAARPSVVRRYA
jgi:ActR/RegA family two-component response regulator